MNAGSSEHTRIRGGYALPERALLVGTINVRESRNSISNAVKCGEVRFGERSKLLIYWLLR